jgi:hypothetical protein
MFRNVIANYLLWPSMGLTGAAVGVLLVIGPKWLVRIFARTPDVNDARLALRLFGAVAACIGVIICIATLSGPSLNERLRVLSAVIEASPEDVVSARFEPIVRAGGPGQIKHLFSAKSPEQIRQLCDALHQAEWCSRTHLKKLWHCRMIFNREDETIYCKVCYTEGVGVFLTVTAEGYSIASFRCDALGPVIESWAKEAETLKPREQAKTE